MMRVTFLGTSAACPTVRRNVSAIAVQREGDLMLFDCGEGTQRQMMRYGTGFSVWAVFITHMHADHFVGVTGMLRTMALQGRDDPLLLTCPVSGRRVLEDAVHLGFDRLSFPVEVRELKPGDCVARDGYEVRAFRVNHGMPALGYVLREDDRRGRFDVERARALGVPEGPAFGRLHRGETVEVAGRVVRPEEVVGPGRPGRTVVYTGDTRPVRSTVEVAAGADLLVHECTFAGGESARARATFHSTAAGLYRIPISEPPRRRGRGGGGGVRDKKC
ncbi:MAG: ribonuclease Z, partial [Gammaproteobacteria bacterium]|nr:ribonuclease Z [Gammaproteobacteria bacterium]